MKKIQSAAMPTGWQRGSLLHPFGEFDKPVRVWVKKNTEKPLKSFATYWIFSPMTERLAHATADGLAEFVRMDNQKDAYATEDVKEKLNKIFLPLVKKVIKKWERKVDYTQLTQKQRGVLRTMKLI